MPIEMGRGGVAELVASDTGLGAAGSMNFVCLWPMDWVAVYTSNLNGMNRSASQVFSKRRKQVKIGSNKLIFLDKSSL
jgi:hypothetical protein